jgi:hypothetical protein
LKRVWSVALLGVLSAGIARAAELRASTDVSSAWNSNAGNASDDSGSGDAESEGDVRFDTGLKIDVRADPNESLNWRFSYAPTYEKFLSDSNLDNWRHRAFGTIDYPITRKTTLSANGSFTRSLRSGVGEDTPAGSDEVRTEADQEIDYGSLGLTLAHTFSRRWAGNVNAHYGFTQYNSENRSDTESMGASTGLDYRLSQRQFVGGGFSFNRQLIQQADVLTRSGFADTSAVQETRSMQLYGSWRYAIDPLWSMNLRAGPSVVDSDFEDTSDQPLFAPDNAEVRQGFLLGTSGCPELREGPTFEARGQAFLVTPKCRDTGVRYPPASGYAPVPVTLTLSNPDDLESGGSSNTAFATLALARSGKRTRFNLSYVRSLGESYGGRTSTISDTLSSNLNWDAAARWKLDFRASYTQQQATNSEVPTPVVVPNDGILNPDLPLGAAVRVGELRAVDIDENDLQIKSWSLFARANWRFTEHLSVAQDLQAFEFGVSLSYAFDPIHF